jgi:uncharacterized protein (TIGR03435 family)
MRLALSLAAVTLGAWVAAGPLLHSQDAKLQFEVASIRASAAAAGPHPRVRIVGGPGSRTPTRFVTENVSLYYLVSSAYDVKRYELVAPRWMESTAFDVTASVPEGATREQFRAMLQNLLAERFGLSVHREKREVTGYDLVARSEGAKPSLVAAGEGPERPMAPAGRAVTMENGNSKLNVTESMDQFAAWLTNELRVPVANATGLRGAYEISLVWHDEGHQTGPEAELPPEREAPGLVTALPEQLGLRLKAKKLPVDALIVDKANRLPSEN